MKKYHVFSEKIIEVSKMLNCPPKAEFAELTEAFRNIKQHLSFTSISVTVNSCFLEIDEERMYEYILQYKGLSDLIYWINKNILMQIDALESKTLEVRLRIATSMLNKVINEKKINKLVGVVIHDNFVKNLKRLYFDLSIDELPF
jgi:hypothetical protein